MKSLKYFRNTVMVNAVCDLALFLIEKNVPEGQEIRTLWGSYLPAIVQAVWMLCVIWGTALIWIWLKRTGGEKRRVLGRMATALVAIALICRLVEASVALGTTEDPEHRNKNGTLTVKKGDLLEKLYLYEAHGLFYRSVLRPMENTRDTDPNVSEQMYYERIRKKKLEERK